MKTFLLVLAICSGAPAEPASCVPSPDQASVYEQLTFARCVQERERLRTFELEAYCTGSPWAPPHAMKG